MQESGKLPTTSVIIITKDRRTELKKAIDSIRKIDYPKEKLEIIVVEEAHSPQEIEGVKYIFIPWKKRKDFGYPRNLGVKNAKNEIIVFTDDDCTVEKDWLKQLVSCIGKDVAGVAGGVLVKDCNAVGYCENILGFPGGGLKKIIEAKSKISSTDQISTCNCAYQKLIFNDIGYFKENTPYSGEDYDFTQRVCRKYKCLYNPNAIVYHKARGNLWKIFRWFNRRGICQVYLVKMGTSKFLTYLWDNLSNSLIVRFLCLFLALSLIGQNKAYIYALLLVIYYFVIAFRYRFQWQKLHNIKTLLLTPVVKLVMDLGTDWGRIIGPFILLKQVISDKRRENK